MKLREDQLKALRTPPFTYRRQLLDVLLAEGWDARLEEKTGDLVVRDPGKGPVRVGFDPATGHVSKLRDSAGRNHGFACDERGRPLRISDSAGSDIRYEYNREGQVQRITDAAGTSREIVYKDRLPVELLSGKESLLRIEYGKDGIPVSFFDARGGSLRVVSSKGGQIERLTGRDGTSLSFRYAEDGRLSELVNQKGAKWRFVEDRASGTATVVYPDGGKMQASYREEGTERIRRRDGRLITVRTGGSGRVEQVTYPNGKKLRLSYDDHGNLLEAAEGDQSIVFKYGEDGRLIGEEAGKERTKLEFSEEGRLLAASTGRGTLRFEYGEDERISAIHDWDDKVYELRYDSRGLVGGLRFPGGLQITRRYNAQGLLESSQTRASTGSNDRVYAYDANGILARVKDGQRGEFEYQVDAEDRLTGIRSPVGDVSLSYDRNGNTRVLSGQSFEFGPLDEILGNGQLDFSHDEMGNMASRREGRRVLSYTWDSFNRLTKATRSDGTTVNYEYDILGRRTRKTVNGVTTQFFWSGFQLIGEETGGPEGERVDYLYVPGTSCPLAMRRNGQLFFYETDHIGSPLRLFDSSGRTVWAAEPLGPSFRILSALIPQPLRYPGQYEDEETGLYYNVFRYYDPGAGRYISPDPLFFGGETNPYVYARNNPLAFADTLGRLAFLPILAAVAGAAAIGAVVGAAFAGVHQATTNAIHGDPWYKGMGSALAGGAIAGAAGGVGGLAGGALGFLAGGPAGAVVGAIAGGWIGSTGAGMAMAAASAPEGKGAEACMDALIGAVPFVGAINRYRQNPNDPQRGYQLLADVAFDVVGIALTALGAKKGYRQLQQAQAAKGRPATPLLPEHLDAVAKTAQKRDEVYLFRPVNENAVGRLQEGSATKGLNIKGKSADSGPHKGLIPVDQEFSKLKADDPSRIPEYNEKVQSSLNGDPPAAKAVPYTVEGKPVKVYKNGSPPPDYIYAIERNGVLYDAENPQVPIDRGKVDSSAPPKDLTVLADPETGKPMTADYDLLAIGTKGPKQEPQPYDPVKGVMTPAEEDAVRALQKATEKPTEGNPDPARVIHHGPETRNPHPEPFKGPVTAVDGEGNVKVINSEQELANYFNEKNAEGYNMEPNPGWGWTQDANGNYQVPPK